jgi:hypothetical protein
MLLNIICWAWKDADESWVGDARIAETFVQIDAGGFSSTISWHCWVKQSVGKGSDLLTPDADA